MRAKILLIALAIGAPVAAQVQVVTTLPTYAAIASEVGGERVQVESIARGDEDAHFVKPKPSYALMLKRADLFVTTGLDLELWAPTLVDKSGNRAIRDGQPGFVAAHVGIPKKEVPASVSREAGDVHIYGNPHLYSSPIAAKQIAANIAAGLERVDPDGVETYRAGLTAFQHRIDVALYGEELLELLDSSTLDPLAREGRLVPFLEEQDYEGEPLLTKLGGWLERGLAFRGQEIIAYHKNWIYFADLFGLRIVDYVEPKPGIPPSARHVKELIDTIQDRNIRVLLAASYFDPRQPELIAERTGCAALILPLGPVSGVDGYFGLIDLWVDRLAEAFQE